MGFQLMGRQKPSFARLNMPFPNTDKGELCPNIRPLCGIVSPPMNQDLPIAAAAYGAARAEIHCPEALDISLGQQLLHRSPVHRPAAHHSVHATRSGPASK